MGPPRRKPRKRGSRSSAGREPEPTRAAKQALTRRARPRKPPPERRTAPPPRERHEAKPRERHESTPPPRERRETPPSRERYESSTPSRERYKSSPPSREGRAPSPSPSPLFESPLPPLPDHREAPPALTAMGLVEWGLIGVARLAASGARRVYQLVRRR
jgi:hypothetical protein